MKKEVDLLLDRSINSLVLSVDHFNRAWDRGRTEAVLILLDHSFELLLKAAILHKGGKIREKGKTETYGFEKCIRTSISNKIITKEHALTLQTINGLRDAAQHHIIHLSEQQLYMHSQAGVTLFKDILDGTFHKDLIDDLPKRVLPISTTPPLDINTFFENELGEINKLLVPGTRHKMEAKTKLRSLAIFDKTLRGDTLQPSDNYLDKLANQVKQRIDWRDLFPGAASINFTTTGTGHNISLRITKNEGVPIKIVPEGTNGATRVALKTVNDWDFYNLTPTKLAKNVGLTVPKLNAIIQHLNLRDDKNCYKCFQISKSAKHHRYSQKAIHIIKKELPNIDVNAVWLKYRPEHYNRYEKLKETQK